MRINVYLQKQTNNIKDIFNVMDIKVMNYKLGPIVVIVIVFLLSRALISVFTITGEIHARSLANF